MAGTRVAKRYDQEQVELALHTLALTGCKYEHACDLLKTNGLDIPKQTLWSWVKGQHADRYEEIRTEVSNQVAQRVASQAEQIMLKAGDLEELIMDQLHLKLLANEIPAKELPGALRNVTTTKALNNDKVSAPIRGRPNVITQDRTAEEIFRSLRQLEPGLVVDSTAQEIPEIQEAEQPSEASEAERA